MFTLISESTWIFLQGAFHGEDNFSTKMIDRRFGFWNTLYYILRAKIHLAYIFSECVIRNHAIQLRNEEKEYL